MKIISYLKMTVLFLTAALAGAAAAETEKPFRGTLQASEIPAIHFPTLSVEGSGTGKATHLGRFTVNYHGEVNLLTFVGTGSSEFIATNGDRVFADFVGQSYPTGTPGLISIVETYTITGGTDRFAGATGSFTLERLKDQVTGSTSGSFDGTIVLQEGQFIAGESVSIAGGTVSTWARVNGGGKVIWVGLTIPLSLAENMPARGPGPAGAFAVLNYPAVVQQTTYFNHAEMHSNLHGHPTNPNFVTKNRNSEPHFDFHFYSIPVAQVFSISPGIFPAQVTADRLPVGYAQPDAGSVPQMGRHGAPLTEFTAVGPLDKVMIAGFLPDASYMHFIEPMISSDFLLARQNFTLPVPQPAVLGRATKYPTECVVLYDKDVDAYHFVFKGFEAIE